MRDNIEINDLISKFLAGEASPEEAIQLEDWKAASVDNKAHFEGATKIFASTNINEAETKQQAWIKVKTEIDKKENSIKITRLKWWKLGIAASVIVFISISVLFKYSTPRLPKVAEAILYKTDSSAKNIQLEDGSHIVLATNSSITFDTGFGKTNRNISLTGSAFVSVKHDSSLPFVINMNQLHIMDIGTKFYINSKADTVFVAMQEGEVLMYNDFGAKQKIEGNRKARYVISAGKFEVYTDTLPENSLPENLLNNRKHRRNRLKSSETKTDSGNIDKTESPVKADN
ncbi:MAG TPA: FecR family protein [Parafilimonas sp.]|nr:FecR family protein [Parafilimonas sp.]